MALILLAAAPAPLFAQEAIEGQSGEPPERIDILVDTTPEDPGYEECEDDRDAATITGEIVVCRRRTGAEHRLYDQEAAERRHAERTQGPQPVDVAGPGIFRGKPTIGGMCFIPPCPKDPVYMIDFEDLPETPSGSDADRMARGLAPRGNPMARGTAIEVAGESELQDDADELGLPPVPEEVSPSGSASPAEEPSG